MTQELAIARKALKEASADLMRRWKEAPVGVESKAHAMDFVSAADLASEDIIRRNLSEHFADDGLLSEESDMTHSKSGRMWITDPLDGTINYLRQNPLWCTALALQDASGETICAVICIPALNQEFYADHTGCYLNDKKINMMTDRPLQEGIINVWIDRYLPPHVVLANDRMTQAAGGTRALGSGLVAMCFILQGILDTLAMEDPNIWDWVPGALMIRMAGGACIEQGNFWAAGTDRATKELWSCANLDT